MTIKKADISIALTGHFYCDTPPPSLVKCDARITCRSAFSAGERRVVIYGNAGSI
jgi:hypothetical protein